MKRIRAPIDNGHLVWGYYVAEVRDGVVISGEEYPLEMLQHFKCWIEEDFVESSELLEPLAEGQAEPAAEPSPPDEPQPRHQRRRSKQSE